MSDPTDPTRPTDCHRSDHSRTPSTPSPGAPSRRACGYQRRQPGTRPPHRPPHRPTQAHGSARWQPISRTAQPTATYHHRRRPHRCRR